MALRNLVFSDESLIRKKSKVVTEFDENLDVLLDDMKETMRHSDGVGLAAVQVGVLKRVVVIEACGQYFELVNPKIISQEGSQCGVEGCLSVKSITGEVIRPERITVNAQNRYGDNMVLTLEGLLAVVVCHEIDHLDGILFIDKMIKKVEK
ncbi:MAG: peptide deformylase [Christensenellales bacterium]